MPNTKTSMKRKSDIVDLASTLEPQEPAATSNAAPFKSRKHDKSDESDYNEDEGVEEKPKKKKARTSAASTSTTPVKETKTDTKKRTKEEHIKAELIEFDEQCENGTLAVYDDCNEIRRKVRLLLKEPGFKITHWLRDDLDGVNSNSYNRFMSAKGPDGGAGNGTYFAAYRYFERRRIAEGKPKTAKRKQNERGRGFSLETPRSHMWVYEGPSH